MQNVFLLLLSNTGAPRKEVYFMAIIDILQHYDAKKKAAHAAKTVKHGVRLCTQTLLFKGSIKPFNNSVYRLWMEIISVSFWEADIGFLCLICRPEQRSPRWTQNSTPRGSMISSPPSCLSLLSNIEAQMHMGKGGQVESGVEERWRGEP